MASSADVRDELASLADPARAAGTSRFLQMAPGGYGEGDRVIGVSVPDQRKVAGRYWRELSLAETATLLTSGVHEERLTSLFILVRKFAKGDEEERGRVFRMVLANTGHLNNWDLVDSSAPYIVGPWLIDRDRSVLDRLAESSLVWDRRIAVMATFAFIRVGDFHWTFRLSERLLRDPHDLVHKAVGWMLREVGNRDRAAEEEFLARCYRTMPRVMLRYAIEKFEPQRRREYLSGAV
ncbi:3-methyladenine DNA glycosylase AlkD [Micromonospora phaseoli]|uniref:3-methyladenine DNA glycosylase AlkD n=1 Tax=Micromonospora phaseoli TaxID=1144548 RepID=A0A1H7DZZ0_9ACTN|nr:DNA alkylation repair protein [Micromonospora phaseoli]PZW00525.1 3-methyladenine DNA glycosylase AlkD [Micromonospora phaseoli]GIJ81358.1 DNA alkylation repair protein [Micromonospora phaseoli]SEK07148.1 3-methyladenine DNA glycosylase AlkD [Micromonospora phaseoli]